MGIVQAMGAAEYKGHDSQQILDPYSNKNL